MYQKYSIYILSSARFFCEAESQFTPMGKQSHKFLRLLHQRYKRRIRFSQMIFCHSRVNGNLDENCSTLIIFQTTMICLYNIRLLIFSYLQPAVNFSVDFLCSGPSFISLSASIINSRPSSRYSPANPINVNNAFPELTLLENPSAVLNKP